MTQTTPETCPRCDGSGRQSSAFTCEICRGRGTIAPATAAARLARSRADAAMDMASAMSMLEDDDEEEGDEE